jgi:hypothetical protein
MLRVGPLARCVEPIEWSGPFAALCGLVSPGLEFVGLTILRFDVMSR